jgi:hypothetical protein
MHVWRRLIALFLLLAFTPGSLLAAMPLVWCVGDDGHRGVEYRVTFGAKHIEHQALGSQADGALQNAAEDDGCRDWQLIGKAKVAKVPDGAGVLTFGVRQICVLPALPALLVAASSPAPTYSGREPVPDIRRDTLRSVVLRI